ncbi:hypothetical protein IFR05_011971 [Cadophora sp. M221]|nr:hypothetical protein IFR05_011971 [Cadophora sp. M221]
MRILSRIGTQLRKYAMNPCYRPGITALSHIRLVTSKYTFPSLEASPFILGAIAITMWEALQPGPDHFDYIADYVWLIPPTVMMQFATGYLIYHGYHKLRWEWYPIDPMAQAVLDVVRTYACCYIIGLICGALGLKMIFAMASYMLPYDSASRIPTANWTFRTACVFLVLAYMIILLGIGILASRPLARDRKRLRMLEGLDG